MLANILQCTGWPPNKELSKRSVMLRLRNPRLVQYSGLPLSLTTSSLGLDQIGRCGRTGHREPFLELSFCSLPCAELDQAGSPLPVPTERAAVGGTGAAAGPMDPTLEPVMMAAF